MRRRRSSCEHGKANTGKPRGRTAGRCAVEADVSLPQIVKVCSRQEDVESVTSGQDEPRADESLPSHHDEV